jgi:pSer/pThr/pTyr-binding forkhead associated (FHA) protein
MPHLQDITQPRRRFPSAPPAGTIPRLALLDNEGDVEREIPLQREVTVVGRERGDLVLDGDDSISPEHAVISWSGNEIRVRDLGSANGSWVFVLQPQQLSDGDVLLIGSQVIRFRQLRQREDEGPALAGERRSGLPPLDDAMLEQLRADGTVRDVIYLSPGRTVLIGREHGDWVFPYDPTMSARHAEVRSIVDRGVYVVRDLGSRNGLAVLVRGERTVLPGERLLLGRRMLRVELS